MDSTLFSIGHGNKSIEEFINELRSFDISYLVDIRTSPYSKWNSHFNQSEIQNSLSNAGIRYVYMGDTLGGLPKDSSCYTEGRIDYTKMATKKTFLDGLERLVVASQKGIRLAIMCSESEPEMCHRSKLIGQVLIKRNILINHIVGPNRAVSQIDIINILTKGNGIINLFGDEETFMSRKTYL
ncbi:MAG: DUF488 domain-containing protein [Alistipes sp.]|nr:DUF488 domain-containing protein [Alistipes sp.]MBQ7951785.1 DUF488 domain-containing protein [Alistipes sp.]